MGETVLTTASAETVDFAAEVEAEPGEQIRSKNKETLMDVINNTFDYRSAEARMPLTR
ncbi:MAG: hypothetical protein V8R80_12115 [Eubacterium sp.]